VGRVRVSWGVVRCLVCKGLVGSLKLGFSLSCFGGWRQAVGGFWLDKMVTNGQQPPNKSNRPPD
jgi:hypothetical protein